ncbi:MAG TPA: aldo/keto reductase [Pyrinomonadaceae bacterium]|nr:aldo/keto reductase [Pyrinomonadaceae bacterium]
MSVGIEKRRLGATGLEVSVLGFGGSEIGYEQASLKTVERLLGHALDAGLNCIDTAECYLESEELIGQAVSGRRKDYYLFTKCGHAAGFDLPDWDARLLRKSIDRSLQRLRTDHLDLLQLHSCSEEVLREGEVIEVLQRAREQGKTRFIGYSGDSHDALYAVETGAFDTLQTSISIADQQALDLTLPRARSLGMGVIAKRPIANAVWKSKTRPESDYVLPYWERLNKLRYNFLDGDLKDAVSRALRFTLSVEGVSTAIVGTTKPERWRENAELLSAGPLSQQEFDRIRARWKEVAEESWTGEV